MSAIECHSCSATEPAAAAPLPAGIGTTYQIDAMDCATEESLIRARLAGMPEVSGLHFNLMQRTLRVLHAPGAGTAVASALAEIGFQAQVLDGPAVKAPPSRPRPKVWPLAISLASALGAEIAAWTLGDRSWPVMLLALTAIVSGGLPTYRKGWIAVRNVNFNMNALMSIAVTGALLIGVWPEAAMVMALFALAEEIEARSLDRARNAIRGLLELVPEKATVHQPDGTWKELEATEVPVGSRVRVKPGERIALDGEVLEGRSSVNQAPITGESLPVDKEPGDPVFAGTINDSGSFEFKVTAPANSSTLARIIHAVEEAQGTKAPTQRFVDQFARYYTPSVFAVAVLMALLPPLFFGGAWHEWIYRALVLLVIACPCALVISTPVTIVSGLAAATRHGILVKGGAYLEQGRKLRWLALDKTGTLTHGKPVLTDMAPWDGMDLAKARPLAASLAARSDHPVSRAVVLGVDGTERLDVSDFAALPGLGVEGRIDGTLFRLGNHRLIEELGICSKKLESAISALESEGRTVVALMDEGGVKALFAVADTLKETSREAVAQLHALGVKTMMLTGDNPHTAQAIAAQAGIDEATGNLLPEDKRRVVEELTSRGKVGMVGDGINDAPALARADIGFAMGAAGTDTAIETADVALMDDDLRKLPAFLRLSRATSTILAQNITVALGIKAVFLALTLVGKATMWMAVFADMGASLLVVFNGLRLLRR